MAQVTVLGAAGQIGQPLSLLLKMSPLVGTLKLYDVVHAPGVAIDLNHIDTPATVSGYLPDNDGLKHALTGSDIVVIPAGIARKPGMTRDQLFDTNASIIQSLVSSVATTCPKAYVLIITNPVNSTLPIAAEALKKHGVFNPARVFGVTTLDVVRASTFIAQVKSMKDPKSLRVPVIGGHSGATIIPLISQSEPSVTLTDEERDSITYRVQFGGDEIVKAKAGAGSATTCMAYAGFRFVQSILKAMNGEQGVVEEASCYLPGIPGGQEISRELGVDYCGLRLEFGSQGAQKVFPVGKVNEYEQKLLGIAITELQANIKKGVEFSSQ